jgi:hypothetical protein
VSLSTVFGSNLTTTQFTVKPTEKTLLNRLDFQNGYTEPDFEKALREEIKFEESSITNNGCVLSVKPNSTHFVIGETITFSYDVITANQKIDLSKTITNNLTEVLAVDL